MKAFIFFARILVLVITFFLAAVSVSAGPKKILFFTKSSGWEHSVISWKDGRPSFAEKILLEFGKSNNWEFTFSKDGSKFSPDYLAQFDAVSFYTSGNLCSEGTDKQPPMTPAGKQALLECVRSGKGFIGIHSATDTFHTANESQKGPDRYLNHGTNADPYVCFIGGEFIIHGAQQVATNRVVDPTFPGLESIGDSFAFIEEWYSLKDFAPDDHCLTVIDAPHMNGSMYERPTYPNTWARMEGKGRVWYTALGHREDVWTNPTFQQMLVGGIKWALGEVSADVTPNIQTVAPGAYTNPEYVAPKAVPVEKKSAASAPSNALPNIAAIDPPRILGISHVAVKATDVEKSVAFYRDFLGYAEEGRLKYKDDGSLMLVFMKVSDTQWIEIFDAHRLAKDDRLYQLCFRVEDAEAMRAYLEKNGFKVPAQVPRGQIKNFAFCVREPHNYWIEFQQYTPEGWTVRDQGKFLPDTRISDHIAHAGVLVDDVAASQHFYEDLLGLKESWRGSKSGKQLDWLHVKLPESRDFVEFMLETNAVPHFCLEVADIEKAKAKLEATAYYPKYGQPIETKTGKNHKRQLNLYDPEGVRVELMERATFDGQPVPPSTAPLPTRS